MVTVEQLMTRELVAIDVNASVSEVAQVMRDRRIGSVFVEEYGRIIGIVTEADIVRKVNGYGLLAQHTSVEAIMSRPLIGIEERRPITEAADLMDQHRTRHLAVLKSGAVVGVLSVRDLLKPVSIDEF